MTYIATFFSHFGTIKFKKLCDSKGIAAKAMPVPRSLSSSCGTCVQFECEGLEAFSDYPKEIDRIAVQEKGVYREVYKAPES